MEGRYGWLTRQVAREEMQELLAVEDTLSANRLVPHAVAVFPLSFRGDEQRYAPIGRGLAEMLSVDLANVRGLIVVERVRLQALLNELQLARSEYVDPTTAPRVGMLLAAGRIVGGAYDVTNETLRIDASLWDTEEATMPEFEEQRGSLRDYFRLQKQLVFALLDEMGIDLAPEDREQIERVPTENLQAFLAYSRGLEQEDAGNYEAAARFFREASQLDPEFQEASDKAEASSHTAEVAGTFGTALGAGLELEPPILTGAVLDPLEIRTQNLNENIGSFIVPGLDDRDPGAEATASDAPIGGLPDPPPPPPREN
jgi:TolB-like protein